ncbi:MAG: hypothetical protein HRF49_01440 [bacterium]|jgi:hypothetical protein
MSDFEIGGEMDDAMAELAAQFAKLAEGTRDVLDAFSKFAGIDAGGARSDSPFGSWERLGDEVLGSVRGIGNALWRGGFDDAGRRFLRNFAGKIGDDVSGAVSEALGGSFFADLFGGLLGELVRGLGGLFGKDKKAKLPPAKLPELFSPPEMMSAPLSLLPSSAFLSGRAPRATINVTVNGIVGSPRDVADEITRIVTRTLVDLTRRGA